MRVSSRIVAAGAAIGMSLLYGAFGITPAGATPTAAAPFVVEDGSYPDADRILAERGVRLKAGNGNIVLAPCAPGGGLLRIMARGRDDLCFRMTGATGYLSLEVPRVHGIQSDGVRDVSVAMSVDGAGTSFTVDRHLWTAVGEAADPQGRAHTLLEITATGPASPGTGASDRPYLAKLGVGNRTCTGTLVDPYWVLTTASCFAENPAQSLAVPAGAPQKRTTAIVGRGDLNGAGGHTSEVTELVPHADRDLVMARLASPATAVVPLAVATAAPVPGEGLKVAGYGRTRTVWAPAAPHTATFGVGAVEAAGIDLTATAPADATVCLGDTGAPVIRETGGQGELVAVTSRSWQGGCLGVPATETRTGAHGTRADVLADWVRSVRWRTASIKNVHNGNCLYVPWQTPGDGANARQSFCDPQYTDQLWRVEKVAQGYQVRNTYSNRCLYVPWQTPDNGAAALQTFCDAQFADQVWQLDKVDQGYQIRNTHNNRCLVFFAWQDSSDPARVYDCVPSYNDQVWRL
ncbi:trypsin-like serine protease [Streptomyces sp. BE20]|nr:trypsin-like serine protease [Streptomyces sp. BE20]